MSAYDAIVIGAGPGGLDGGAPARARRLVGRDHREKRVSATQGLRRVHFRAGAGAARAGGGIADDVLAGAGPEVREVGVFAGERIVTGEMPRGDGPLHAMAARSGASISMRCSCPRRSARGRACGSRGA